MNRPWMPLYISEFISETASLTATETGIYIRLLAHCWQHKTIPNDDRKLAVISHCSPRLWRRHKKAVLQLFVPIDVHFFGHIEVSKRIRRYEEISNKRKVAAEQMHNLKDANALQMHTDLVDIEDKNTKKVSKIDSKKESKKQTAAKGERIPPGWRPSAESITAAKAMGFSDSEIALTTAEFLDYWSTLQGPKALNSNWDYTWRNRFRFFLRNPQFRRPQSKSGNGANPDWASNHKGIYGVDWW